MSRAATYALGGSKRGMCNTENQRALLHEKVRQQLSPALEGDARATPVLPDFAARWFAWNVVDRNGSGR
jgi:hypothetical protein